MAVGDNIVTLYEYKFSQIFELLAQQRETRLPQKFRQGTHTGAQQAQAIKQVGIVGVNQRVQRYDPITPTEIPTDARWVYPLNFDNATYWDTMDEVQTLADPRSSYVEALDAAMKRAQDAECIRAFFETSHNGQLGTGTVAFPVTGAVAGQASTWNTGNQIPVNQDASVNTGLTVAKLRAARRTLYANETDLDAGTLECAAKGLQLDNLLAEAQVINRDFNQPEAPVLEEGKITRFLGINFTHTEQLTSTSDPYVQVPVWHSAGMHFGTWMGIMTKITQRMDLRGHPWQVYINSVFGSTRLQEKMVMQILCA